MFEVRVISRQTILPSSLNPHSTNTFHLSLLDQIAPSTYFPLLLFYTGDASKSSVNVSSKLKTSLSETLAYFYPLAGKLREDGLTVDCNGEGVDFLEARVDGQLSEFLQEPTAPECNRFVPSDYYFFRSNKDKLLAVQLNIFDCGGVAIGMWISHRVADGTTLATFVGRWAATARGADEVVRPIFDSATHFPAREPARSEITSVFPTHENIIIKRFVFGATDIARLRAESNQEHHRPTRVEAVSALLWQSAIRAQLKAGGVRLFVAIHVVNVRGRMMPPLPDHSFGNLCVDAVASWESDGGCNDNLKHCLERLMGDSIEKIDSDYISQLQGPDGYMKVNEFFEEILQKQKSRECGVDVCLFSSWCRFGFYDADFGWGKPECVSITQAPCKNVIILMETRCGDGIEAWVSMDADKMAAFEQDQDLLSFISPPESGQDT